MGTFVWRVTDWMAVSTTLLLKMDPPGGSSGIVLADGRHVRTSSATALIAALPSDLMMTVGAELTKESVQPPSRELSRGPFSRYHGGARHSSAPLASHENGHTYPSLACREPIVDRHLRDPFSGCPSRLSHMTLLRLTTTAHDTELAPSPIRNVRLAAHWRSRTCSFRPAIRHSRLSIGNILEANSFRGPSRSLEGWSP